MYNDVEGPNKPVEVLDAICHTIPIHLILGEIADYIPRHVHRALVNPASGRRFASITAMSGVGHLVSLPHVFPLPYSRRLDPSRAAHRACFAPLCHSRFKILTLEDVIIKVMTSAISCLTWLAAGIQ